MVKPPHLDLGGVVQFCIIQVLRLGFGPRWVKGRHHFQSFGGTMKMSDDKGADIWYGPRCEQEKPWGKLCASSNVIVNGENSEM